VVADEGNGPSESELIRSELKDKANELEGLFLALEQALRDGKSTLEAMHLILRQAHSLKGTLGMAEKPAASACVHAMESAFICLRDGHMQPSSELFDLVFASLDQLARLVEQDREDMAAFEALERRWAATAKASNAQPARGLVGLPFGLSRGEAAGLRKALALGKRLYLVEKTIYGSSTREDYENLPIYADITELGMLVARHPHFEDLDRSKRELVLLLLVATQLDLDGFKQAIFDPVHCLSLSDGDRRAYLTDDVSSAPSPEALRTLIVEDDFLSRLLLQKFLAPLGESHVAIDGEEAIHALNAALESGEPYHLVCLDIMMPKMDGQAVLRSLREMEERHGLPVGKGAKVIMTTCLKDSQSIMAAFREQCDAYLVKPIARAKLLDELRRLGLTKA
jgi:two-component system chemotaxis response regulator CheY